MEMKGYTKANSSLSLRKPVGKLLKVKPVRFDSVAGCFFSWRVV